MRRLAILGASGHGKVVADIAQLLGWDVVFFDDAYPDVSRLEVWRVVGDTDDLLKNPGDFEGCVVAIGDNVVRLNKFKLLQARGANLISLVHPSAVISRYSTIASGCVVMAGAVINPFSSVAECCILNTGCVIEHDCLLGEGVHVSPGAKLAGAVTVGRCSWIGIGATVRQCVAISSNVVVGAGAVVVNDLPSDVVAVGVPAEVKK